MVDVSIVIVNYNSFALLDNCLRTLFMETKEITFEVIVIDNCSTEKGIDQVILRYPKVKFILNDTGRGFASANNQGFKAANGEYILMLNNDVVFFEDVISKVVKFSKENNDQIIIGCKLLNEDHTHQISVVDFDTISNLFGENFFLYKLFPESKGLNKYHLNNPLEKRAIEVDAVKGAFLFIPNNILKELDGLDERFNFYYEETDLCYRWKSRGGKVYYYPNGELIHIGGASTDSNLWFKFSNQHVSKIQFFQKHFKGIKFLLAVSIHELGLVLRFPLYFVVGLIKGNKSLIIKSGCYLRSIFVYPHKKTKAIA
ncbi:MAG: glycosyltransferase family 2 protein [Melioribacter sp.]|nr:glycosyltransferase family 2 protein [Melioribacter sp.]